MISESYPNGSPDEDKNQEIELKLSGEAAQLEAAWTGSALGRGRDVVKRLETIYYDTSDRRLYRRGLALRVRREGDRYTQTVKTEGESLSGLLSRGEFSNPLPSKMPDLQQITDTALRNRVGLILPGELEPLFTTHVERRVRKLRRKGARAKDDAVIEAALDLGEITSDRGTAKIAELELELLKGPTRAVYDLASEINEQTALSLQTLSKSERGYALAFGEAAAWVRAEDPALSADTKLSIAFGAILRSCIKHWLDNQAAVLDGSDPEGVHQLRVALRRLRSALSVFKQVLPPNDVAWINREARWLIQSLGPARDWDVFLAELLAPLRRARPHNPDLEVLAEAADDARRLGYERAHTALRSGRYTALALDLGRWTDSQGWLNGAAKGKGASKNFRASKETLAQPVSDYACKLLRKWHKRVLKQGRHFERLSDEERHSLRIAVKKLRYACEFFAGLYPKSKTRPYLKALKGLQDQLGHLNDVVVAEGLLKSLLDPRDGGNSAALHASAGLVVGWYSHMVEARRPEIEDRWRNFARSKPFWSRARFPSQ